MREGLGWSFKLLVFSRDQNRSTSQRYFSQISPRHIHAFPILSNLFSRVTMLVIIIPCWVEFLLTTALSRDLFRCLQLVAKPCLRMHRDTTVNPHDLTNRVPNDIWPHLNGNLWHDCLSKRKHGDDKEKKKKKRKNEITAA